jgi:effector-binding domain-containing protein
MLDTPEIVYTPGQLTACIHLTIPRSDAPKVMGPAIEEVMAAVAAQGKAPTGPWFTHHLRMDPDVFDFEVCVPVAGSIAAAGRVRPGEIRSATVARTVYRGGYEGLGAAWGEFISWIAGEGHEPAADLWEVYVAGPESSADPAAWRTELNRPLLRRGVKSLTS